MIMFYIGNMYCTPNKQTQKKIHILMAQVSLNFNSLQVRKKPHREIYNIGVNCVFLHFL